MNATTVLHILDLLAADNMPVWLDGGWGVEALLGRITRSHHDLDLVLALEICRMSWRCCVFALCAAFGLPVPAEWGGV